MTWKFLTDKTQKPIYYSEICSALDPTSCNLSIDPLSSIDFCMLPSPPLVDDSISPSADPSDPPDARSDPAKVVFLRNHMGRVMVLLLTKMVPLLHFYRSINR